MEDSVAARPFPRWTHLLILLGLFLSVRGYRALEGDQAYRLPLLLRRVDATLFRYDPFVRSFDTFNPHRGALALIELAGRPLGLSTGLLVLFVLTFLGTGLGVDRIARAVWPRSGPAVGLVAFGLFLCTLAGNVGTNHLFEPIVLDRQMALALGWLAVALAVEGAKGEAFKSSALLGAATLLHPTFGLQLAVWLVVGRFVWVGIQGPSWSTFGGAARAAGVLGVAILPGLLLNLRGSNGLLYGLDPETFRVLSVELQGPQHMLPHLWRMPQWLAWGCFPLLAAASLLSERGEGPAETGRVRVLVLLGVNLLGLAAAWAGVEIAQHLRLTLFQPFRMATVARGLCLVFVAGHVTKLWACGVFGRTRACLIAVGLAGDWSLVVVTLAESTYALADGLSRSRRLARPVPAFVRASGLALFVLGLGFLAKHDTESGHVPLLGAVAAGLGLSGWSRLWNGQVAFVGSAVRTVFPDREKTVRTADPTLRIDDSTTRGTPSPSRSRRVCWLAAAWVVPLAAAAAAVVPDAWFPEGAGARVSLARRCRFGETPVDDFERLALWCRGNTPADARFVGPPGLKGFRLWSHRSLAFNRAGSPYTAQGLGDWAARYADHVDFRGTASELARAYLHDRHGLERRFDDLSDARLADLAERQGADFVIAAAPGRRTARGSGESALEVVRLEGRWAVYRRDASPLVRILPLKADDRLVQ